MSDDLNKMINLGTRIEDPIEELREPPQLEEGDNKDNYSSKRSIESMSNPAKSMLDDIFGNSIALSEIAIASSLASHKRQIGQLWTPRHSTDSK